MSSRATIHAIREDELERSPMGEPGLVLGGKYRLDAAIARGGMGRVWRATHTTLNRPVAVKFVEGLGATEEERIERFLKEAKVAASVRHKNVVDIIDFGTSRDGEPYMVMELLEGETLDQRLQSGPMTTQEVVDVTLQILSGLDAVHRAGIVHRDMKPGNVYLTDDSDGVFARLLDFGISQGAEEAKIGGSVVVGTPEYMSPEQAFGDPLDARSDLYSVGVLMYEMLSGVLPFDDPDPQKVVDLVAHGTPAPLVQLRPDIPSLCTVVDLALAKEPGDRFQNAREMRRAILNAVGSGPETTGRHAVIRDSHVSQTRARAAGEASTQPAEAAIPTLQVPPGSIPPPSPAMRIGSILPPAEGRASVPPAAEPTTSPSSRPPPALASAPPPASSRARTLVTALALVGVGGVAAVLLMTALGSQPNPPNAAPAVAPPAAPTIRPIPQPLLIVPPAPPPVQAPIIAEQASDPAAQDADVAELEIDDEGEATPEAAVEVTEQQGSSAGSDDRRDRRRTGRRTTASSEGEAAAPPQAATDPRPATDPSRPAIVRELDF